MKFERSCYFVDWSSQLAVLSSQCEIQLAERNDDDQFPSVEQVLPEQYQSNSTQPIIVFTGIAAAFAILIIAVAVVITSWNQVEADSEAPNAPPLSAFSLPVSGKSVSDAQPQETFAADLQGQVDDTTPEII